MLAWNAQEQTRAHSWVTRLMQAAMLDTSKLPALLTEAAQLKISASIAQATGAGVALGAGWIWQDLDPRRTERRVQLVRAWKKRIREEVDAVKAEAGRAAFPRALKKSPLLKSEWLPCLQEMENWFRTRHDGGEEIRVHAARLAIRLLLAGFRTVDELAGLSPAACDKLTTVPRELAMLQQAVKDMDLIQAQSRAVQLRQSLGVKLPDEQGPRSAWELAATLTEEEVTCRRWRRVRMKWRPALGWTWRLALEQRHNS